MILVTGGTGLVGAHLLHNLCKTNNQVVAIYRDEANQKITKEIFELHEDAHFYPNIVWKKADITNVPELEKAFDGVTHVYHAAAMVSFSSKKFEKLNKVNIEGTANIVNICIANKIEKLCYVSSIATLSKTPGVDFMTEDCNWNPEDDHSDYSITKYGAEMEVWRGTQEGLNTVIVNPGLIFGLGCWEKNTGKLLQKIKTGLKFYTTGSTGVVDVIDVVKAMTMLMNSDIQNQRFILVSSNYSFKDLFTLIANQLNVKPPKFKATPLLTEIAWRLCSLITSLSFNHIHFDLNKYSAKAAHKKSLYKGDLIKKSVANFSYTPFETTLQKICSKLP